MKCTHMQLMKERGSFYRQYFQVPLHVHVVLEAGADLICNRRFDFDTILQQLKDCTIILARKFFSL